MRSQRKTRTKTSVTTAYDRLEAHPGFDGEGIELAMELDLAAMEAGIERIHAGVTREGLVKKLRQAAGRRGGKETLDRYGRPYFRALARVRWGKTPKGALPAIRDALRKDSGHTERAEERTEERTAA